MAASQIVIQPAPYSPPAPPAAKSKGPSKKVLLISAGILAVLIFFWFIFTARSVVILTDPVFTQVDVSGFGVRVSGRYVLRPGDYEYSASAPGYFPKQSSFTVSENYDQNLNILLEKRPGKVSIQLTNEKNTRLKKDIVADIFLGETKLGNTQQALEIPAGPQQLTVKAPRYRTATLELDVIGMEQAQTTSIALEPSWGIVEVSSTPQGAEIWHNNRLLGNTPKAIELDEGNQSITLKKAGFKDHQQLLTVTQGETLQLAQVSLIPADGRLQLNSSPVGANVLLNGQYQGTTPLELALNPNEAHEIQLIKMGYHNQQKKVVLNPAEEQNILAKLQPVLGTVRISSQPENSRLTIDGTDKGLLTTTQILELASKPTVIRIEKAGFAPFETKITPNPASPKTVKAKLLTLEQAKWAATPKLISSNGSKLKLFRPDQELKASSSSTTIAFTMGASRREAGRRANEVQRQVRLKRAFYFAIHEVTNGDYARFNASHNSGSVKVNALDAPKQPVVNISWNQAARYCNWLSAKENLPPFYTEKDGEIVGSNPKSNGYRLPTEAEWAFIARYRKGTMLRFSWGNELPPTQGAANLADRSAGRLSPSFFSNYSDGSPVTANVGSFNANHREIFDLNGNAAEWVHDFYAVALNLGTRIPEDPLGPKSGEYHVVRGPSWTSGNLSQSRLSYRDYATDGRDDIGFRIARYVESVKTKK